MTCNNYIHERKKPCLDYEKVSEKSRKIELFPKGLVNRFGQKSKIFPSFYFPQNRPGKCETFVVEMSFNCNANKTHFHNNGFALSLVLKAKLFGTRKWPIGIFSKGLVHGFSQKAKFFHLFILGKKRPGNVFEDILERKNLCVDYK